MASFQDFLQTGAGKAFANGAGETLTIPAGGLQRGLYDLSADLVRLSVKTSIPTYEPIVDGLMEFAIKGARLMNHYGIATRQVGATVADSKNHTVVPPSDGVVGLFNLFNALAKEREYHGMMFDAARETVRDKSPSEMAYTALGLVREALDTSADPYKKLKDAVATAIRAIQEAGEPGSIAQKAKEHREKGGSVHISLG